MFRRHIEMKHLVLFSITCIAFLAGTAQAASITCAGRVTQIIMHAPDTFLLQLDSMDYPVYFCRTNATWSVAGTAFTTSAETCRTLVGVFLAAKAQDKSFGVIYFDGDDVPSACNAFGPWKNANIRYFQWAD